MFFKHSPSISPSIVHSVAVLPIPVEVMTWLPPGFPLPTQAPKSRSSTTVPKFRRRSQPRRWRGHWRRRTPRRSWEEFQLEFVWFFEENAWKYPLFSWFTIIFQHANRIFLRGIHQFWRRPSRIFSPSFLGKKRSPTFQPYQTCDLLLYMLTSVPHEFSV